ncbi:MAG TPA: hypothetical protein VMT50_00040 [Steroidobacteraceae bacterium]|nr:hypothetical protein [Steroidobacteraceae bacterium]
MTAFIIFCAVMIVAASVLVLLPLLRPIVVTTKGESAPSPATVAAVVLALALPLAAALLYAKLTSYPWSNLSALTEQASPHGDMSDAATIAKVTAELEERLKKDPTDVEGWRMLGRSYLVAGRAKDAIPAYEKAISIAGAKDPSLSVDLAEALVVSDDPALQPRAKQLVDAALLANATNPKALWYAGVIAYREHDVETTKARWTKLLEQNPPDEIRQVVTNQLAQLGVMMPAAAGGPSTAAPQAAPAAGMGGAAPAPQGRIIKVAVSLDPSLAAKLKPGAVLFVAARQPGIPGPPLAAQRLTADQLPMTVTLSDANSMIEGRNLSSVDDVEVVARVAFGGTAAAASGDLVGSAVQKKGGPTDLAVTINKVQP